MDGAMLCLLFFLFNFPIFRDAAPDSIGPATAQLQITAGDRVDVDIQGTVYVTDRDRNMVRRLNANLVQEKQMGGMGWGNDQFDHPSGIWARNGIDVFVADEGNHRIQRFDRNFNYISTFSTRESDNPDERFGYPSDVAVSRFGDLYICDTENSRILKLDAQSRFVRTFGGIDAGKGRLGKPTKVAIGPEDRLYVLDGPRIVVFDAFGNFSMVLAEGLFHDPSTLFADPQGVMVVDGEMLYCFDQEGRPVCAALVEKIAPGEPHHCFSLAAANGTLYLLTEMGLTKLPDPRLSPPGTDAGKE